MEKSTEQLPKGQLPAAPCILVIWIFCLTLKGNVRQGDWS